MCDATKEAVWVTLLLLAGTAGLAIVITVCVVLGNWGLRIIDREWPSEDRRQTITIRQRDAMKKKRKFAMGRAK